MMGLFLFFVFGLFATPANAATLTVCSSGCSETTLWDAYDKAALSGDTIEVTDTRTYTESFVITKAVSILSTGASPATWKGLTSGGKRYVLKVESGAIVTVDGFIVEPSQHHGIEVKGGSNLTLKNIVIDGFVNIEHDGVGVKVSDSSTVKIEDSRFENLGSENGGAIFVE